ncbi:MAG: hypothetical protein IH596_02385 [Bacteroidales bacterium]|nr:hypothetical protein [Bacteroidales bacterium]
METGNQEMGKRLPRRRFLTTLMQGLIGAGLAVTGGYLILKEETEESCSLDFTCTLCGKTEQCGLPAAKSYREYESKKGASK